MSGFLSRYDQRKSADNLPRLDCPRKLTNSDIRYLICTIESETHAPLAEIAINTTFFNVSTQTLRRRLREEGIRKWKAIERCLLTTKDAKARYK